MHQASVCETAAATHHVYVETLVDIHDAAHAKLTLAPEYASPGDHILWARWVHHSAGVSVASWDQRQQEKQFEAALVSTELLEAHNGVR